MAASVPALSAAVERLFSVSGKVINPESEG